MALTAIKTTTGYLVEGTDAVGKDVEIFIDSWASENYDRLVEAEQAFHQNEEFQAKRAKLPDPERDLYLSIFGKGDENTDTVLHTTLVEAQDARDGIAIDWSQNPVTAVLRLIQQGQSSRLRLVAGQLVDMGPTSSNAQSGPVDEGETSHHSPAGDNQFIG